MRSRTMSNIAAIYVGDVQAIRKQTRSSRFGRVENDCTAITIYKSVVPLRRQGSFISTERDDYHPTANAKTRSHAVPSLGLCQRRTWAGRVQVYCDSMTINAIALSLLQTGMSQLPAQPSCRPPGHLSHEINLAYQQPTAAGSSKSAKVSSESAQRGSQYLRNSSASMNAQSAVTGLRQSPASPDAIDVDSLLAQLDHSTTESSSMHAIGTQLSSSLGQAENSSLESRTLSSVQPDLPILKKAEESQRETVGATNNHTISYGIRLGRINEDVKKIKTSIDSLIPPLSYAGNSFGDGTQ
ncbi:uncharacterized protein CLUP02_02897 [Colletotrichum lupini]|uniref:Uncharacterized protein n=1 Tax=Colletotrichum lupini TaxID=145971 RepID=A0A9Q8SHK0_9PEZI|nr:uncharacterized protein CLUP02_02897 [Colletotrichum lupini]UQC77429.1 hypothetical protein CLUP02_02897 [Colletotrichum lupini]